MRKAVLGSIAAVAAGAGVASAQGFAAPPQTAGPAAVVPASGNGPVIPPYMGGDPGVIPVGPAAPNGAPQYPPPGFYGAPPGPPDAESVPGRVIAPKWWFNTEYLIWFARAQRAPNVLLTTGTIQDGGVLGRTGTATLVGGEDLGYGTMGGFRLSGGYWKGEDRRIGYELGGFLLEQRGNFNFFSSDANGLPVISRPFTDATTGTQGSLAVSFPTLASGSALVATTTQTYGAEGNVLFNVFRSCPDDRGLVSLNAIAGFKYVDLREDLSIASASTLLGNNQVAFAGRTVSAPATIGVQDIFETSNRFYGGQLGLAGEFQYSKWTVAMNGKVAVGLMNQVVDITGRSELLDPTRGLAAVNLGGLYATPQTMGRYRNDEFAIVPEGSAKIGYNWSSWLTTSVGYSFLYLNRTVRPGSQFTPVVNPALVPTSPSFGQGQLVPVPNPILSQEEFWLQGVTVSILVKY